MESYATPDEEAQLAQLDQLVAAVAGYTFAQGAGLPAVAGADLINDIYNAVIWSLQAPYNFFNWIRDQLGAVLNWVTSATGNIKDFIVARVEWVANNIVIPAVNAVANVVSSIPGAVSSAASWVWQQVQPALSAGWDFVSNIITWLRSQVQAGIDALGGFVQSSFNWLWGQVQPVFSWVTHAVGDAANWLYGQLSAAVNAVGSFVQTTATWLWGNILPVFDWVSHRVQEGATWVAGQTFNYVIQGAAALGDGFQSALEWLMHGAFGDLTGTINRVISVPGKMLSGAYHGLGEILADLDLGNDTGGFARFMYSLCAFIPTLASLAVGLGPIYAADALQNANRIVGPTLLGVTDIRDAYLRGLLDDAGVHDTLSRLGYNGIKEGILKELFFEPAPPSDLIRFLVREVFDPTQRAALGLDADYPAAADAEGRKVGLAPLTMRNYWAAHWQLPSPSQVYEMLHRGRIDAAAVDAYLKAADYSPAWRTHLAGISYHVPGRIDLRRMYAAGVIDEPRLLKGYKDLGYNDGDAAILTGFAKKLAAGTPKDLPRGVILEAYRDGESDRNEARTELEAMGFAADDVQLMLDLEDLTNAKKLQNLVEDAIEADLKFGLISEAEALTQLSANAVPARRAQLLVNVWRQRHHVKALTLTAGQVQHASRERLIPDAVAIARLQGLGFNLPDAQIMLALAHPQSPIDSPATLSEAQLFKAFREKLINQAQLMDRLARRGHTAEDVQILVQLATPDAPAPGDAELTKAELIAAARKKVLPVDAVQRRLAAKGMTAQDVDVILKTQGFDFTPTGQLIEYPRRELTVAQLSKAYRDRLLEEKEFRFRLGELSYADADVNLLVELNPPKEAAA